MDSKSILRLAVFLAPLTVLGWLSYELNDLAAQDFWGLESLYYFLLVASWLPICSFGALVLGEQFESFKSPGLKGLKLVCLFLVGAVFLAGFVSTVDSKLVIGFIFFLLLLASFLQGITGG